MKPREKKIITLLFFVFICLIVIRFIIRILDFWISNY